MAGNKWLRKSPMFMRVVTDLYTLASALMLLFGREAASPLPKGPRLISEPLKADPSCLVRSRKPSN